MPLRPTPRVAQRGFTLIEILIVISIISILATILFPVFSRARENARRSSCSSNLKQISLAFTQYAQDYDERFPLDSGAFPDADPASTGWVFSLQPYMKSLQVFQCATELTRPQVGDGNANINDYWANANIIDGSLTAVQNTSNTFIAGDGVSTFGDSILFGPTDTHAVKFNSTSAYALRHLEGANYAFVDGHSKWLKPGVVSGDAPNGGNFTFALE